MGGEPLRIGRIEFDAADLPSEPRSTIRMKATLASDEIQRLRARLKEAEAGLVAMGHRVRQALDERDEARASLAKLVGARWAPVFQTRAGGPDAPPEQHGDCFRACICALLKLPTSAMDSPSPMLPYDEWEAAWQEQLARYGFYTFGFEAPLWFTPPGLWIASVPSLNLGKDEDGEPIRHAVVMERDHLLHDPALGKRYERVGMEDILAARFLVPLYPSDLLAALRKQGEGA